MWHWNGPLAAHACTKLPRTHGIVLQVPHMLRANLDLNRSYMYQGAALGNAVLHGTMYSQCQGTGAQLSICVLFRWYTLGVICRVAQQMRHLNQHTCMPQLCILACSLLQGTKRTICIQLSQYSLKLESIRLCCSEGLHILREETSLGLHRPSL